MGKRMVFKACDSIEECEITHQPSASRMRLLAAVKLIAEWGEGASLESVKAYARAVYETEG